MSMVDPVSLSLSLGEPLYWVSLCVSTFIMGFAIKYIDAAYDEEAFSRKNAVLAAICCGVFMGYWIANDASAAVFLLAICLGVAITKKIDNPAFILGILLALFVPAILKSTLILSWLPLAALVIACVVDEEGNDMVKKIPFKGIRMFFHYRLSMEVMMAVLTFFGFFAWPYFLAFASFDLGYQMVTYYVDKKLNVQQEYA
ncbi:MAG: hypothetical protein V1909_06325 [Candidatus Micrarchaeota archaeon]